VYLVLAAAITELLELQTAVVVFLFFVVE